MDDLELSDAIAVLVKALKNAPDLRRAWKDNIAMAMKDSYAPYRSIHDVANEGAERFLDILCRV
jgi:hypothetical protein